MKKFKEATNTGFTDVDRMIAEWEKAKTDARKKTVSCPAWLRELIEALPEKARNKAMAWLLGDCDLFGNKIIFNDKARFKMAMQYKHCIPVEEISQALGRKIEITGPENAN